MSSLSKKFKKAGKKLKKGTKKATKAVSDTAKDAADGVSDAAKKVAQTAEMTAERAVHEGERIGAEASKFAAEAYDDALELGEAAWDATLEAIERYLTDDLADLLIDAAMDVYRDSRKLVDTLASAGRSILADARGAADFARVITSAAAKKKDAKALESVRSLALRPEMQAVAAVAGRFKTLSYGSGGSAAYGVGAEGCYGFAHTLPDAPTIAGFYGVGGVANAVGAAAAAQFAAWSPKPGDLAGPYLAVTLEVEIAVGGGVQVVFAVPATEAEWLAIVSGKVPAPVGIVVFLGGGGELSASLSGGYTWVF